MNRVTLARSMTSGVGVHRYLPGMASPIFWRVSREPHDVDSLAPRPHDEHERPIEEGRVDEFLTMDEIEARYAPDLVLIAEPKTDEMQRVLGGKIVFHGPDGDECWHKARELNLDRVAVRFLGEYPEH